MLSLHPCIIHASLFCSHIPTVVVLLQIEPLPLVCPHPTSPPLGTLPHSPGAHFGNQCLHLRLLLTTCFCQLVALLYSLVSEILVFDLDYTIVFSYNALLTFLCLNILA